MSEPANLKFYSNWEIMAEAIRHPRVYRRCWAQRGTAKRLNGWWFRNPYRKGAGWTL